MNGTRPLSANYAFNVLGILLPTVASLATVPFYIHQLGLARYGVISLSWVLLGYFGFLDFGLSRATANALAKLGNAPPIERSRVLVTAFVCNLTLGLAGGLIMYTAGSTLLRHVFKVPLSLEPEVAAAFPWMAAMLPLGMLAGITGGAFESRERFLLSNLLGSFGTVMGQVLPLLSTYIFAPRLDIVIPATLLARLLMVGLSGLFVMKLEWPLRPTDFDFQLVRPLFRYGAWASMSSVLNAVLDGSAQLAIGMTLGAASVALYTVPMTLASRAQVLATAFSRALFPRLSRLPATEARVTTQHATRTVAYLFGAVCAPAIVLSGPFLHYWIGSRFQVASQSVAQIVMFGAWANGIAYLPYGFLQAQGFPRVTAVVAALECLPFLAALWLLSTWLGFPGAALAWSLRTCINCIVLQVVSGCATRAVWNLFPAAIVMLMSLVTAEFVPMSSLTAMLIACGVVGLLLTLGLMVDPVIRSGAQRVCLRIGLGAGRLPRRNAI